jgi:hypothetical protein
MGKKSLIKSTSKKKKSADKKIEDKKKTTTKKSAAAKKTTAKSKAKSSPKAKAAPKAKSAAKSKAKAAPKVKSAVKSKAKAAPKAKSAVKPKAKAAKKPAPAKKKVAAAKKKPTKAKKKVTLKELLSKQFDRYAPKKLYVVQETDRSKPDYKAPSPLDGKSKAEKDRIKALLGNQYSMEALKAAAKEAAAGKAAAEKAAAGKAAAEKAAAEKAAAEEPKVAVSYDTPPPKKEADPVEKAMKFCALGFGIILLLIIGSSTINSGNFYLRQTGDNLEIWQGRFSPMGEKLLLTLPGVSAPEPLAEVYAKRDVYPLIFNYYLDKADSLLAAAELPDFEEIKNQVNKARKYAATVAMKDVARARLDKIDRLILLYKADVAITKGTREALEDATAFLKEADRLSAETVDEDLIAAKLIQVQEMLTALEAQEAAAAQAAEAEAEAEATEEAAVEVEEAAEPAPEAKTEVH